jgi:hypothetical protein
VIGVRGAVYLSLEPVTNLQIVAQWRFVHISWNVFAGM